MNKFSIFNYQFFRSCLKSMRLRTLPLSLAGVMLGAFIAATHQSLSPLTVVLLFLTTALLQVLSNLSNELGDTLHGTDTDQRLGIHYSLQDGDMTVPQMKCLITVVAVCCALSGLGMIWASFGSLLGVEQAILVLLGAAAMAAAMRYTLGHNPYGYRGWGDLFVFVFFGLVSVCGGYYICSHPESGLINTLFNNSGASPLLPAVVIGLFSVGVLNVNNIRDMKTDAATRTTVALKLGARRARIYQTVLIVGGWLLMIAYTALSATSWTAWLFVLTLPLYVKHLVGVWHREEKALDPMLPQLVISTFLFALLSGVGMIVGN